MSAIWTVHDAPRFTTSYQVWSDIVTLDTYIHAIMPATLLQPSWCLRRRWDRPWSLDNPRICKQPIECSIFPLWLEAVHILHRVWRLPTGIEITHESALNPVTDMKR